MKKQRGYTATELVAVAGTISVAMAMATPGLMKANQSYKLNTAASQVSQSLQNARFEAIRRNAVSSISVDPEKSAIILSSTTNSGANGTAVTKSMEVPLPSSVTIAELPSNIPAPAIVQTSYNKKDTFKDSDYKNLGSCKKAVSFAEVDEDNSGSGSSGSGSAKKLFRATFTSKGLPATRSGVMSDPGIVHWVYLKNSSNDYMAITISSAGSTQVWRYKDTGWVSTTGE